jgi:hypothetical protein
MATLFSGGTSGYECVIVSRMKTSQELVLGDCFSKNQYFDRWKRNGRRLMIYLKVDFGRRWYDT